MNNGNLNIEIMNDLVELVKKLSNEVSQQKQLISQLYSNYNVRTGWQLDFNKAYIDYQLELNNEIGVTIEKREQKIIVSLTSFPERMYEIRYTLYSLLHQTLKPDMIILWLAKEEFPNMESDIAESVLQLKKYGVSIEWCEDIKSYKKLLPALKAFPDDIIVTADDDVYYPENWLELLYQSYLENPNCIHCHRGHKVLTNSIGFESYELWKKEVCEEQAAFDLFPTGVGGVLYPPRTLHENVLNKELFMKLAPGTDDVWFWSMALLRGTKIKIVKNRIRELKYINYAREIGLGDEKRLGKVNLGFKGGNDVNLNNMLEEYPQLIDIVKMDSTIITHNNFIGSANYWEGKYVAGGNSGAGSYNHLALFKAAVLNAFVADNDVKTVIEWGCGDGNQLNLSEYPEYLGFDVSQAAVKRCQEIFKDDTNKRFIWCGGRNFCNLEKADLAISLDVIYHLVEDDVFENYMHNLFESSDKYVIIYSCNFDKQHAPHVRCRKFTDYVESNFKQWQLGDMLENAYPYDENNPNGTSWSDFYFYEKLS